MALVLLPGLSNLIDDISEEKKLPPQVVEAALREALLKGYERYRRTLYLGISEDPFDEEYFSNFDVGLDLEEEGYRVLASKIIVDEVESEDHQIAIAEVMQVADDAQVGDTVVLDVTPEKEDFGRMAAATTKQVLAQKLRDQQRRMIQEEFADLEDPVLTARVIRFERQSVIMAVSSGLGRPEVEAELPRRDQLPNDNYRANATFKVFLKEVSDVPRRGPQLFVSRSNAGLVVYLFENEVPEIQEGSVRIVAVAREANPPSRSVGPRTKVAVDSIEREVDPVGACIGARGSRIQQVVNELRGEKIDVIRWSNDPGSIHRQFPQPSQGGNGSPGGSHRPTRPCFGAPRSAESGDRPRRPERAVWRLASQAGRSTSRIPPSTTRSLRGCGGCPNSSPSGRRKKHCSSRQRNAWRLSRLPERKKMHVCASSIRCRKTTRTTSKNSPSRSSLSEEPAAVEAEALKPTLA